MMVINQAGVADIEEIAALIDEVEAHYGSETRPDRESIRGALFGPRPKATVLLARRNGAVAGMASYSFHWPAAGSGTSLFLKELFVREVARRQGVAGALMLRLREIAEETGCCRIEWTAERASADARAFYRALGVDVLPNKMFYRWTS